MLLASTSNQHRPGGLTCKRADTSSRCKAAVKGTMPAPWARTVKLRRVREEFHWGCTGCRLDGGTSEVDPLTVLLLPNSENVVMLNPATGCMQHKYNSTAHSIACCPNIFCTGFCQHCQHSSKIVYSARKQSTSGPRRQCMLQCFLA